MLQGSKITDGFIQLSNRNKETGNDHLKDYHNNGKMKLSSDLGKGEGWDQEWKPIVASDVENIRQVGQ